MATGRNAGIRFSEIETSMSNSGAMLPSTLVLSHAARAWLQEHPDESPQALQMRGELSAALVRYHRSSDAALELATKLGGTTVEQYFIRKSDRIGFREVEPGWDNKLMWNFGGDVNTWWYYAACLDSSAGRAFRKRRQRNLLILAREICATGMVYERLEQISLFFGQRRR